MMAYAGFRVTKWHCGWPITLLIHCATGLIRAPHEDRAFGHAFIIAASSK